MPILPHPPVLLSQIRVHDIWLLLAIGGLWELGCRTFLLLLKRKPAAQRQREHELFLLQQKTAEKRKLGPQAFVETSKLERQVLVLEKEVTEYQVARKTQAQIWEKRLLSYGNVQIAMLVFFLYYSIPILSVESSIGETPKEFLNRLLFPLSYCGIGVRLSKWGMLEEHAEASVGALVVMWSAQVTVGKIMDGMDALFL